jgi:hypothetical protein
VKKKRPGGRFVVQRIKRPSAITIIALAGDQAATAIVQIVLDSPGRTCSNVRARWFQHSSRESR